jgi:hypothetical protein
MNRDDSHWRDVRMSREEAAVAHTEHRDASRRGDRVNEKKKDNAGS